MNYSRFDMRENPVPVNHSVRISLDTMPNLRIDVIQIERDYLGDEIIAINWKIAKTGDWLVRVVGNWRERDEPGKVVSACHITYYAWPKSGPTKKQLKRAVYEAAKDHLVHELKEGLWIDGERCFEPH